jgi:NAD(P)-dependent dehydrogenase (short-subunit alcohol dehydrogenase family)
MNREDLRPLKVAATLAATGVAAGLLIGGAGAVLTVRALRRARHKYDLHGKVVLITGSSRGLGLALAEEFAVKGSRVVICAREQGELSRARAQLERRGADVLDIVCDVSDRESVQRMIDQVRQRFGEIDVVVNNAGIIGVGPYEEQKLEDFEEAMNVNFWGVVNTTLAVLPEMRRRHSGRIVNITSIGGKVAVPHLLPYSCAKFAAVAFSEGLRAEIKREGVLVTTVVPGLMRTGSYLNADFKGKHQAEFGWFSMGSTTPFTAIAARRAARQIVDATISGTSELIITWQAELLARLHGLFPGLVTDILAFVNRTLPTADGGETTKRKGWESESALTRSPLTAMGRWAAQRYNERPASL